MTIFINSSIIIVFIVIEIFSFLMVLVYYYSYQVFPIDSFQLFLLSSGLLF